MRSWRAKRGKKRKNCANNNKKETLQRDGKGLFSEKADKDQIQKNIQGDFSLLPQQKSFNNRCLRNFFLRTERSGWFIIKGFYFSKKSFEHIYQKTKNAKKEIWKQTYLFFSKKKRCLFKSIGKTHISEKFTKMEFLFWSRLVFSSTKKSSF